MNLRKLGFTLSVSAISVCAVLHLATFVIPVPGLLILFPFALLVCAVLCVRAVVPWRTESVFSHRGNAATIGWILLVYALFLFVYLYKTTGGATSVGMLDGQYVYLYKSNVIRPITEAEYKMFPTLVVRLMSAWIGMMAFFCVSWLRSSPAEHE
jgi:hypothetical protein